MNKLLRGGALLLLLILGSGCSGQPATPTARVSFPTPPTLPPRGSAAPATPAATASLPDDVALSTPLPSPTRADEPTPTPSPAARLPGAYVSQLSAPVYAAPGGQQVASLSAGARVGLLQRAADDRWLLVLYRPQADQPEQQGWMRAAALTLFSDQAALPISASSIEPISVNSIEPAAATPVKPTVGAAPAGLILFQTRNGGDIYSIAADGSGLRRLASGFEPALSPDGRTIAFTRWEEPRGLWIMQRDGSNARQLFTANRARSPSWLPDGSAILFERSVGESACYQTPFGCLGPEALDALFGGNECIDTPLGRLCRGDFALVSQSLRGITQYTLADGSVRDLPAPITARAPMAGGDGVLFLDDQGLAAVAVGSNDPPQRLVTLPGLLGPAQFSPDARAIFGSRRSGDHWDIWRWQGDGGAGAALTAPPALRDRPIHAVAPALSPDGRQLLFLTNRRGPWEVWIMDTQGRNARPFAPAALAGIPFQYDFADERVVFWGR